MAFEHEREREQTARMRSGVATTQASTAKAKHVKRVIIDLLLQLERCCRSSNIHSPSGLFFSFWGFFSRETFLDNNEQAGRSSKRKQAGDSDA